MKKFKLKPRLQLKQTILKYSKEKILLVSLLLLIGFTVQAATITSAQNGAWLSPSTWVGGVVPTNADDAIIDANHTVTVNSAIDFASLVISTDGVLTLFNGSVLNSVITNNGALNINGATTFENDITNNGTFNWIAGNISSASNSTLTNFGTANFNTINVPIFEIDVINESTGLIVKGGGNGFQTITTDFTNIAGGTVSILAFKGLNLTGTLTNSGTIDVSGTLQLVDAAATFNIGSSLVGTGTLILIGANTVTGTADFIPAVATVNHTNGAVTATGVAMQILSGTTYTMGNTAELVNFNVVNNNGTLNINGATTFENDITNNGTFTWTLGNIFSASNSTLTNFGTANFNTINVPIFEIDVINESTGLIVKGGGNGFQTITTDFTNKVDGNVSILAFKGLNLTGTLNNSGTIDVTGTLQLVDAAATFNTGSSVVGSGTLTLIGANTITGTADFIPGVATVNHNNGAVTATGVAMQIPSGTIYNMNNNAALDGFGVVTNDGTLNLNGATTFENDITNNGTFTWTFGNISSVSNSTLTNFGTANFNAINVPVFEIDVINESTGQIVKGGGNGFQTINTDFTNKVGGTVSILAFKGLNLTGTLNNSGTIDVSGTLQLVDAAATFNIGSSLVGTGAFTLIGANTVTGTADFIPAVATVNHNNGAVTATGVAMQIPSGTIYNMNNTAALVGFGVVTNDGTLNLNGGTTFENDITNNGTFNWIAGNISSASNSTLTNFGTANFNAINVPVFEIDVINESTGQIVKGGGNGFQTITTDFTNKVDGNVSILAFKGLNLTGTLTNSGTIDVSGTLQLIDAAATFNIGSSLIGTGTFTLIGANTVTGTANFIPGVATVDHNNGAVTATGVAMQIPSGTIYQMNNTAALVGFGVVTNDGTLNLNGGTTFENDITNNGTFTWTFGNISSVSNSTLTNFGTANFNAINVPVFEIDVINEGTGIIVKGGGNGFQTITTDFTNKVGGTINVLAFKGLTLAGQTINNGIINNSGSFFINGLMSGEGNFVGNITNAGGGTLQPGPSPSGLGCFTFDDNSHVYINSGTYKVEIDNLTPCSGYDQIVLSGTANLGGTLDVSLNYATPVNFDQATIIDAAAISGTFASVNALPTGWTLKYDYPNAGEVTLEYFVADVTPPSGYAVNFTTDPIDNANQNAVSFDITGLEANSTYDWTISDGVNVLSGMGSSAVGGTVSVENIDVSSLADGTLTLSLTSTDAAGNKGDAVTDTVEKQIILDSDGDGVNDDVDNCPDTVNADQADNDNDSMGDLCDDDDDNDGILDVDDNCPFFPGEVTADVTPFGLDCFGYNYQLTITPSGGTAPYTITATGVTQDGSNPEIFYFSGFTTPTNTVTINVTDNNGCALEPFNYVLTNPEVVVAGTAVSTAASCANTFDGTVTYSGQSGGTPHVNNPEFPDGWEYFLLGGPNGDINQGSPTFINLPPGFYDVGANDANGCGTGLYSIEVLNGDDEAPVLSCPGDIVVDAAEGTCSALVTIGGETVEDNCGLSAYTITVDGITTIDYFFVPEGTLEQPRQVIFGPDGNLYVGDLKFDPITFETQGVIYKFDGITGDFIMEIGGPSGTTSLAFPRGMDFGPDGNLYVSSSNSGEVLRFDPNSGALIDVFVAAGSPVIFRPTGLKFGPDGNLYVSDRTYGAVRKYDGNTGVYLSDFVTSGDGDLSFPIGLDFGPDGNLYVANFWDGIYFDPSLTSIKRYDGSNGAYLDDFVSSGSGGLIGAEDLEFGPNGDLYVTGFFSNNLLRYDGPTGAFIESVVSDDFGLRNPDGLTFGPDGSLYVANTGGDQIIRVPGFHEVEFPMGTTNVTVDVVDTNGNPATCTYTVTVNDVESPTILCPDNIVLTNDVGICGAVATWTAPVGEDNCPGSTTTQTVGPVSGAIFPIGNTTVTYTVTDGAGLETSCSFNVTVTNAPPVNTEGIVAGVDPIQVNTEFNLSADFNDDNLSSVTWNFSSDGDFTMGDIAEYTYTGTYSDEGVASGVFTFDDTQTGVYTVMVIVTDACGETAEAKYDYVVIYDPTGGFVTGGGWFHSPLGALVGSDAEGKANFGLVAKYKKGKNNTLDLDGNTNFQFKEGDFHFKSNEYDEMSLVISGFKKATYRGTGTVNNSGSHKFMVTVIDGDATGGDGDDKFRIKIWADGSSSTVIYDNEITVVENADASTILGGGQIVIHKPTGNNNSSKYLPDNINDRLSDGINVFPNPSRDYVNINLKGETFGENIVIYNHLGQMVWKDRLSGTQGFSQLKLRTYQFDAGIYFIRVLIDEELVVKQFTVIK